MSLATVAIWRRWTVAVLICLLGAPAAAQDRAGRIWQKIASAGAVDSYFPDVAKEVAYTLTLAAPGHWKGVQVNERPLPGWLHIYMIDARHLPNDALESEGVVGISAGDLAGGAGVDEASNTIILNTATWKRLAAATVMDMTKEQPDITRALAAVDGRGLDGARRYWDPATLSSSAPGIQNAGMLMRGALAFVLAHEMGHILIGPAKSSNLPDKKRLSTVTKRQMDEVRACPELLPKEARADQEHERKADMAAVALLGRQCQIGDNNAKLRHAIYMLGTGWYFTAAMSDKLLLMARHTDSPNIAKMMRSLIGAELYQEVIAKQRAKVRRGAVEFAFPSTHPPDASRIQAIEAAMATTPCGGSGISSPLVPMLELFVIRYCHSLIEQGHAR